ncbi:hypothetical protein ELH48_30535 (plasmid) [Rhizobium ruizarguesonis]|uniref:DUF6665 family protein n=1 Tax=Rhizobium ruizarguesonis TaxID=2081791 RepID=UPI0010318011|nr:DUF6665 family protein [Rhizobium ruizarguesonis]TBY94148.1 hypothetical protein E0H40_04375 [Rhizobium leguminosarum bv. viciae]NEH33599.1 hypothetical protein [Rhizobium ruizarguesonis]TBA75977.1 hypothetical protein ELH54_31585 [Rhizobium ruizarguesonis]TBA97502.1 hypothetical protein ELH50_33080 [Rhizobium ruizarguesonis]TBB18937.1 hypothetical protein ELH48_30535 [Rhizobium ruizarguesonis]
MSVRPPQSFRQSERDRNGFNVLEYELMSERADSLGRHGLKVETALAALRAWTADRQSCEDRERLLNDASDAVWAFFIQREICGLRNNRDAIQRYGIPNEVIARLGAIRK